MSEPVKLVILVEGGLIIDIISAGVPVEVVVVDYDIEGADEYRITTVPTNPPAKAYITGYESDIDGPLVLDIFACCDGLPDEPPTTRLCSVCHGIQFETPSGMTCPEGHGGDEGYQP
jgi:hypothetical protein